MAARDPLAKPLKRIVAIGAVYDTADGFSLRDRYWLSHLFAFCEKNRLTIDPEFEVVPLNFAQGESFFDPAFKTKADILMSCLIPTPEFVASRDSETRKRPGYLLDPRAGPDSWRDAARETGARLITVFKDHDEITAADFKSPAYVYGSEFAAPARREAGGREHRFVVQTLFRRDWKEGLARAGIGS